MSKLYFFEADQLLTPAREKGLMSKKALMRTGTPSFEESAAHSKIALPKKRLFKRYICLSGGILKMGE